MHTSVKLLLYFLRISPEQDISTAAGTIFTNINKNSRSSFISSVITEPTAARCRLIATSGRHFQVLKIPTVHRFLAEPARGMVRISGCQVFV